ncbi:hemerythrin domain-containing protein [Nonomuraea sp. NPDC047529]|uniref:hemerythrin domain-containing protein n=1 Tax=Nonomuraea sp. NPDC047529 TaxID=3155623 RepID=UPI0033D6BA0B
MDERVRAFGDELVKVHEWLRGELAKLRAGEAVTDDLRAHCLTFCDALSFHHSGEDRVAFPFLEGRRPELKEPLDRLRREHEVIAALVEELRAAGDPATIERVAAELEAHFDYEERALVPVLNSLESVPWAVGD